MAQVFQDIACQRCGCVCDDLIAQVRENRAIEIENACSLALQWWQEAETGGSSAAQIDGMDATAEEALAKAVALLKQSRAPLICTTSECGVDTQRAAIKLAEAVGGTFDPLVSPLHEASTLALQTVGHSGATLGEIRNRADLIIFWRCDPVVEHPRFIERFIDCPGTFVPGGREDRQVIVVDEMSTATADLADHFLNLSAADDLSTFAALRAVVENTKTADQVSPELVHLAAAMKACRYGVVCLGEGVAEQSGASLVVESLWELVRELNAHTRFVAQVMGGPSGSEVATWQTGYPLAVNFALGYPRYGPQEFSAACLLERRETDCLLMLGSIDSMRLSSWRESSLQEIPKILVGNAAPEKDVAEIFLATAVDGVHCDAMTFRMDDVALPLRATLDSKLPSQAEIVNRICKAI